MNRREAGYRVCAIAREVHRRLPLGTRYKETPMMGMSFQNVVVRYTADGAAYDVYVHVQHHGGEIEIEIVDGTKVDGFLVESTREAGRIVAHYLGPNPTPLNGCTPC